MQIWLWSLIGGLVAGTGGTVLFFQMQKEDPPPKTEEVATKQQEVIQNLTNHHLLLVPCSKDYLENKGDDLCKLMFCWQMTRGIDAKTSGSDCEQISNISNSLAIKKACWTYTDDDERRECVQLFEKRK